jgi:hypothetical protein
MECEHRGQKNAIARTQHAPSPQLTVRFLLFEVRLLLLRFRPEASELRDFQEDLALVLGGCDDRVELRARRLGRLGDGLRCDALGRSERCASGLGECRCGGRGLRDALGEQRRCDPCPSTSSSCGCDRRRFAPGGRSAHRREWRSGVMQPAADDLPGDREPSRSEEARTRSEAETGEHSLGEHCARRQSARCAVRTRRRANFRILPCAVSASQSCELTTGSSSDSRQLIGAK